MSKLSERLNSSSDSDEDILPDISSLKPCCLEPEIPLEEQQNLSNSSSDEDYTELQAEPRIGNIGWCKCGGRCKPMPYQRNSR